VVGSGPCGIMPDYSYSVLLWYGIDEKGQSMIVNSFEQHVTTDTAKTQQTHDSKVRFSFQFSVLAAKYISDLILVLDADILDQC